MPPRRKPTDEERHAQSERRRAQRAAFALNDPERHAQSGRSSYTVDN